MPEHRVLRAFVAFAAVLVLTAGSFIIAPPTVVASTPRPGIQIEADAEFTSENGVTAGVGTAQDPYVIEGWQICTPRFPYWLPGCIQFLSSAITIRDTSAYVVIRNVTLQGGAGDILGVCGENGIALENVSNVRIENTLVGHWMCGISIESSRNVTVVGNKVYGSLWRGISVNASGGVSVYNNVFLRNGALGWQAVDRLGMGNAWDAGYPRGGNYWDDYESPDICRGPLQDDCTAPDGIGDDAHSPGVSITDRYPLVSQPALAANAPPEARLLVFPEVGDANTTFVLNASSSWDVEDATASLEVRWDWDDDGSWDTDWSTSKEAPHAYSFPQRARVRLEVRDSQGATAVVRGTVGVCRVVERAPPTIIHEPVNLVRPGESLQIAASVSDPCGIESVRLLYKEVSGSWGSLSMTAANPGSFVGIIPAQAASGHGSYLIEAADYSGAHASTGELEFEVRAYASQPFVILGVPVAVAAAVALLLWGLRRKRRALVVAPATEDD